MNIIAKVSLSLSLILSACYLGYQSNKASANDTYLKLGVNMQSDEEETIFGEQKVSEIVGSGDTQYIIGYGKSIDRMGTSSLGATVGIAYLGVPENDEHIVALDFEIQRALEASSGWIPYFGGTLGIGTQLKSGSTFNTSTSVNKASYISGTVDPTPSVGKFSEDPLILLLGFQLGTKYKFADNFNAFLAYEYQAKQFDVSYRLENSPTIENSMTFTQRFNGAKFGINYLF